MTDLLSRPTPTDRERRGLVARLADRVLGRPGPDGRGGGGVEPEGRSLPVSAALASLGAVATTLLTCLGLSLIGWFLADGGGHGQTTDALRVGSDVWLVGHGSGITIGGEPLGVVPLALTVLIAVVIYRMGTWAAATSAPLDSDRTLATAGAVYAGAYVIVAVVVCLLVGQHTAAPGLGRTVLSTFVLSGGLGTLGMAAGTGRLAAWLEAVPGWIRSTLYGAVATTLLLVAAAAVLVAVALGVGINDAATMMSQLHLAPGDVLTYAVASAAAAPNAVLLGASYLLGPGFAVGTGTVVSPSAVALGPVPAFPLLAALPEPGPTPGWVVGLMAVPVLVAVVGAVLAQRSYGVAAYDSAALRGFGSGLLAAVLTTLLISLAGGPLGTGRMSQVGAPVWDVLVAAVMAMSIGGLVGGVGTAWWQRRRARAGAGDGDGAE